jgi:hypothetical protein
MTGKMMIKDNDEERTRLYYATNFARSKKMRHAPVAADAIDAVEKNGEGTAASLVDARRGREPLRLSPDLLEERNVALKKRKDDKERGGRRSVCWLCARASSGVSTAAAQKHTMITRVLQPHITTTIINISRWNMRNLLLHLPWKEIYYHAGLIASLPFLPGATKSAPEPAFLVGFNSSVPASTELPFPLPLPFRSQFY